VEAPIVTRNDIQVVLHNSNGNESADQLTRMKRQAAITGDPPFSAPKKKRNKIAVAVTPGLSTLKDK
jgi:hypothetical protein